MTKLTRVQQSNVLLVMLRQPSPLSQSVERYHAVQWAERGLVIGGEGVGVIMHDGVVVVRKSLRGNLLTIDHLEIPRKTCRNALSHQKGTT